MKVGGREDTAGAGWPPQTLPWGHMSRQRSPAFARSRSLSLRHVIVLSRSCPLALSGWTSSRSRARALSLSALLCLVSYSLLSHGSSFSPPPRAKLGAVEGALALHPTSCYCDHAATPPPHSMLHSSPPLSPPEFAPTPFTPHDCTTFTWLGWLSPI